MWSYDEQLLQDSIMKRFAFLFLVGCFLVLRLVRLGVGRLRSLLGRSFGLSPGLLILVRLGLIRSRSRVWFDKGLPW